MKFNIKFLLTTLIIAILFFNVGCSRQDEQKKQKESVVTKKSKSMATPKGAPVKIGAILPLTGDAAVYGEQIKNGIAIAVAQINKEGMLEDGMVIEYTDSRNSPKDGLAGFRKITSDKKVSVVISAMTGVSKALIPVADQEKTVLFCTGVSAADIPGESEWVYRLFITANIDAKTMGQYVLKEQIRKVAILHVEDDFGLSFSNVFKQTLTNGNNEIAIMEESYNAKNVDLKNNLIKIKTFKPDAIYLVGYGKNFGLIPKQIKELGINAQLLSIGTISQPSVIEQAGESLEGTVYTTVKFSAQEPQSKVAKDFVASYRSQFNQDPNYFAAFAYDSTMLIANAMAKNGTTSEQIRNGLSLISDYKGVTGNISFTSTGDAQFDMEVKTITSSMIQAKSN